MRSPVLPKPGWPAPWISALSHLLLLSLLALASFVLFASTACLAEPVRLEQLEDSLVAFQKDAQDAYDRGDYAASVSAYEEILDTLDLALFPDRAAGLLYNFACSAALAKRPELALHALEMASAAGWRNLDHLARDPDLDSLRDTPAYAALVAQMERDAALEARAWGSPSLETPYQEDLSTEEKVAGLSRLWMEAKLNFAFFDQVPDLDWDAEYLATLPRVMKSRSTKEYYRILSALVAKLEDGHTGVVYPRELFEQVYSKPPVRTSLIEGQVLVTGIMNPDVTGLAVGDEVVSIDGVPVKTYAEEQIRPYVCASTPQDRDNRTYDYELLLGPSGRSVQLGVREGDGTTRTVVLDRGMEWKHDRPLVEHELLGDGIGYLAIHTFAGDAPVDSLVSLAMTELRGARALVIDIRENGGGNSGWWVMEHLVDEYELTVWSTRQYRAAFRAWGRAQPWYESSPTSRRTADPSRIFGGPVVLLTSPRTFSAAEDFAAVFKWSGRGEVVGEPTGGSTGQPLFFRLPGGGSARICTKRDTYPDGSEFVGYGVQPDVVVHPTIKGCRSGKDVVLEAAVKLLK
ncbi:MAG: S41 family peptidase [Candidatus Eisenbacteria bacterium]